MTDHPSALVSVPPHALKAIAFNLCSLHDFDPAFVQQNERFAMAAITEYLRATPAPAAPQAAGVEELVADLNVLATCDDMEVSHSGGDTNVGDVARRCLNHLRAPSREPEGGAVTADALLRWIEENPHNASWQATAKDIREIVTALATREGAPADTTDCKRCAGNGEIVTDWNEYLSPPKGAAADHATTDCPDCDGIGKVEAPAEAGEIGAEYDAAAHCVTLAECPPGLFLWNGTLGFKSEYGAMEPVGISPHHQQWKVGNRADAYCADSGEYFWGGTSNHDDRAKLLVYPVSADAVAMVASHGPSALRAQPQALPPISLDGPNLPDENRVWLARQLLDSKLTDAEAYGIVRHSPAVKSPAREDAQPWDMVAPAYRFGRTIQPDDVDHLEVGSLLRFYSDDPWFDDSGDMPCVGQIVRFTGNVERERFPALSPHVEVAALDGRVYPGGGWQCHLFQFVAKPDTHPAPDALPVPVTIFCPNCALPHVDEGEWATTRHHKTHQCQGCGHEWRPFPFATVGVAHPAPDALRVAVEALEEISEVAHITRARLIARHARAALQAEQKGGA